MDSRMSVSSLYVRVYIRAWYTAPTAACTPNNDQMFLQQLAGYKSISPALSKVASSKFAGHLWYPKKELVGLALYDPAVPVDSKRATLRSIKENKDEEVDVKIPSSALGFPWFKIRPSTPAYFAPSLGTIDCCGWNHTVTDYCKILFTNNF